VCWCWAAVVCMVRWSQKASWLHRTPTGVMAVCWFAALFVSSLYPCIPMAAGCCKQRLRGSHPGRTTASNGTLCSTSSCVQTLAPAAVCWALGPVCHHVWLFIHSPSSSFGFTPPSLRGLQQRGRGEAHVGCYLCAPCNHVVWCSLKAQRQLWQHRQGRQCCLCRWPARQTSASGAQCRADVAGSCCMLRGVRQLLPVNLLSWLCCVVRSHFVCGASPC
jgi:hypothetical protein